LAEGGFSEFGGIFGDRPGVSALAETPRFSKFCDDIRKNERKDLVNV
jgi:hypothetical protein